MSTDEILIRIRRSLELARDYVKSGEAHQARAHLDGVYKDIEDRPRTPEWAEYKLVYAGILFGIRHEAAESEYTEALTRIKELEPIPLTLLFRANEDFAKFLAQKKAFDRAIRHSEEARQIAEELQQPDDAARCQLRVINLDLQRRKSPLLDDFQSLKSAARLDGYTESEQLECWIGHDTDLNQYGPTLRAARKYGESKKSSPEYFRGKLSEVRRRLRAAVP